MRQLTFMGLLLQNSYLLKKKLDGPAPAAQTYTVKSGAFCQELHLNMEQRIQLLASINGISALNVICPGQVLKLQQA